MASGPLTRDDIKALWRDVTDESYSRPLETSPDGGIEVIDQAIEQIVRESEAVDTSTQSLFIFPWSGQTDEPASGGRKATVILKASRTSAERPVVFEAGLTILHATTDYGENGGQEVTTGRRYFVATRTVMMPGNVGPFDVPAIAENVGTGYNLPQPGTIRKILQVGTDLSNTGAMVLSGNRLQLAVGAGDVLAPAHILSYIQFTDGANAGQTRRILGYMPGSPTVIQLDDEWVLRGVLTGTWQVGESVTQSSSGATARVVAGDTGHLVLEAGTGTFTTGTAIVGALSGASFTANSINVIGQLTLGSAAWRILDWSDLGVSITNVDFPSGGRLPMLDEIGDERGIPRASDEPDSSYQIRVGTPADVVTPNAIRRAANHVLAPYGLACTFRQVGSPMLRGLYYDGKGSGASPQKPQLNFAYDLPMSATSKFKRVFDLVHFRAYFLLGIPQLPVRQFSCAYDSKTAYDARSSNANDGFSIGQQKLMSAIRAAVERARAGGVRWDLYIETA